MIDSTFGDKIRHTLTIIFVDDAIDHMMAMRMINQAHVRKGRIRSFTSYCGGLPSPAAANNPLAYKFRYL